VQVVNDLTTAAKSISKELKRVELSTKGANWGLFSVKRKFEPLFKIDLYVGRSMFLVLRFVAEGNILALESDAATVFELPLSLVQQSVVQGKNEVRPAYAVTDPNSICIAESLSRWFAGVT
jgi:hypothetical protein